MKVKYEKPENRVAIVVSYHYHFAQYGRGNNVVFSGILKYEKPENRVAIVVSYHYHFAQYGRCNNVVFSGIPEIVPGRQ